MMAGGRWGHDPTLQVLSEVVLQEDHGLPVAVQSLAHDGLDAGFASEADLTEVLPRSYIGDMDLDRREGDGLQSVQDGNGGTQSLL